MDIGWKTRISSTTRGRITEFSASAQWPSLSYKSKCPPKSAPVRDNHDHHDNPINLLTIRSKWQHYRSSGQSHGQILRFLSESLALSRLLWTCTLRRTMALDPTDPLFPSKWLNGPSIVTRALGSKEHVPSSGRFFAMRDESNVD